MVAKGLGWLPEPESVRATEVPKRVTRFSMAAAAPTQTEVSYRVPILDQGQEPACVGYSIRTKLDGAPVRTKRGPDALTIYRRANAADEWAPAPHDGTSTRAGMDVVLAEGLIERYLWAWDVDTMIRWLLASNGPIIVGTWWYAGMSTPMPLGTHALMVPSGGRQGGHAYCVRRYSTRLGAFGIANSWGRGWGKGGYALIMAEHLERLIDEDGEAATAVERPSGG